MTAGVPQKIIDGATILMQIFEEDGPAGKTGLTYYIEKGLGRKVSRRDFADMIHHCRKVLGPQAGKAVIYNRATDQYGFAENIQLAELYIILNRQKDQASRAETLSAVCGAAMAQHGRTVDLAVAKVTHDNYASSLRAMTESYRGGLEVERHAKRLGADAEVDLQERAA